MTPLYVVLLFCLRLFIVFSPVCHVSIASWSVNSNGTQMVSTPISRFLLSGASCVCLSSCAGTQLSSGCFHRTGCWHWVWGSYFFGVVVVLVVSEVFTSSCCCLYSFLCPGCYVLNPPISTTFSLGQWLEIVALSPHWLVISLGSHTFRFLDCFDPSFM